MKPQLLVVDDEAEIRELLQRHFRYLGHDVHTAADGAEALEVLAHVRIDVTISDIAMAGMDGVELLRAIRREFPMIRVIMITGYVTQENILACMRLGAETCIFKPLVDLEQLEAAVDRALATLRGWWSILAELQSLRPRSEP